MASKRTRAPSIATTTGNTLIAHTTQAINLLSTYSYSSLFFSQSCWSNLTLDLDGRRLSGSLVSAHKAILLEIKHNITNNVRFLCECKWKFGMGSGQLEGNGGIEGRCNRAGGDCVDEMVKC